jgi:hypothetical protein
MNELARRLSAKAATVEEIQRAMYGERQERFPNAPAHSGDPDPSHRELVNGILGGRRGLRMRIGDNGRSHSDGRRKPSRTADFRPRAGMTFLHAQESTEATETNGNPQSNSQRGIPHRNRGDIRPRPGIR